MVAKLHEVVVTAADVDKLESEEDQLKFVIAFRELSKILLTLETFTDFTWADIEGVITQQTYEELKSRYLTIHDRIKKQREVEKVSILADIDFNIEIIETDRINVAYIMNLLRNIDMKDKQQKEKDIAHIFDELNRTDNPELKRKIDLIKAFIGDIVPKLTEEDSMDDAFADYEQKVRNLEIQTFAEENQLDLVKLKAIISEYEFSGIIDDARVDADLCSELGFRAKRAMRQKIVLFVAENCARYAF